MPLVLNEEQALLRDSARNFLAEQGPVAQLRALRDTRDADGYSRGLWNRFAEMGYTGMLVPEAHGGLGLGHVEVGVVMEQVGRHLTASPLLASGVVAATAIRHGGSAAQQQALLPQIASGRHIATLAVDETGKHRPQRIALQARRSGDGWRLDGAKTFVLDGHIADTLVVGARTAGAADDEAGITLFLVPRTAPGVAVERVAMVDAHNAARVAFADIALGADAVLGEVDGGRAALIAALDAGRCAAAAELLGLADEAFERTLAYLKERRQFDRLIGEFQGLQHRAAMLYCDLELARAAVAKAAQSLDGGKEGSSIDVSIAKARAGRSATLAVQEAVQMHGGIGMTDAFEIGFFMKRARVLQELFGDANFHADRLARSRGY